MTSALPPQPTTATPAQADGPLPRTPPAATQRRWRSSDLFGTAQEIEIEHGPAVYRLRQTSLGKLILTK